MRWNAAAGGAGAARGRSPAGRSAAEGAQSELLGAAPRAAGAWRGVDAVNRWQEPFPMPLARKKNLLAGAENRGHFHFESVIPINTRFSS